MSRGQGRLQRGEAGLHLAQRQLHVGVGPEVEAQLDRAAHRTRADFSEIEQPAHRLLQRPGGRDYHLLGLERASPSQHNDPGIGNLGVDRGGKRVEGVDPAGREQPDEEIDCGAIPLDQPGNAHGVVESRGATRIPS